MPGRRGRLVADLPEVRFGPIEAVRVDVQREVRWGRGLGLPWGFGLRLDLKRKELFNLQVAGKKGNDTEAGPSHEVTDPLDFGVVALRKVVWTGR